MGVTLDPPPSNAPPETEIKKMLPLHSKTATTCLHHLPVPHPAIEHNARDNSGPEVSLGHVSRRAPA